MLNKKLFHCISEAYWQQTTQLYSIRRMLAWFQVSGIQAQMDMPEVESICFPMNAPSRRSNKNKYFGCSEQDRLLEYLWFRLEMWLEQPEVASEIRSVESEKKALLFLSLCFKMWLFLVFTNQISENNYIYLNALHLVVEVVLFRN